ncbi:PD-(D/E)XK motif protein, partial [Alphaproteobacteria bacterium]|nr:PD-(D/E)XK motif protein [Alphaproteobacteria bacterium]
MNYTNSQNLWKEIDTNQKKESGWFAKLVPVLSSQKVYLAYEAKSLKKTLLIELNHNDLINFKEFKGNGFSIFFENISNTLKRVCIQLVDNQFEEVFFEITDLLIESIKDIKETDLLIKKILDRLTIYQSFFEKPRIGHSKNAEQGMFAELDFMENKLFNKIGINASLDLWKAPDSGLHDFTGKGNSIEIKSTNQIPSQNIR